MTQLKTLEISNIRHLSVQEYGLSVANTVPLRITISNSSCDNSLPKFSDQTSYESVGLYNVKVQLNCSCHNDLTHYYCLHTLNRTTGFQKYEDFDQSYCDHENHHHSIFDDILEELPDDKYVLIGISKVQYVILLKVKLVIFFLKSNIVDLCFLFTNIFSNRRWYGVVAHTTTRVFHLLPQSAGRNFKNWHGHVI